MPLQTKFLQGYYDSPSIDRVDTGLGYLTAMADSPEKLALYTKKNLRFPETVEASFWYLGFNWLDPVLGGGKTPEEGRRARLLRQAISIAVDWEENIAIFQKNQGIPAHGPLPPGLFGWRDDGPSAFNPVVYRKTEEGRVVRRSIEEAKALLREAGYPDGRDALTGKPLILSFDYQNAAQGSKAYLEWYQRQFAKLGIQLDIRATDYNRFQDKMNRGAAQIFLWGWVADYPIMDNFMYPLFFSTSGDNYSQIGDDAIDEALLDARATIDDAERIAKYQEVNATLGEQCWMIPLMFYTHTQVVGDNVAYYYLDPLKKADMTKVELVSA